MIAVFMKALSPQSKASIVDLSMIRSKVPVGKRMFLTSITSPIHIVYERKDLHLSSGRLIEFLFCICSMTTGDMSMFIMFLNPLS